MSISLHRRPALRALVTAFAVTVATLTLSPTSAQADPTGTVNGGTTTWGMSNYLKSATFGRPSPKVAYYTAPATFDGDTRLSTWGNGTGTVAANGSATLSFEGSSLNFTPTGGGWLRLKDLQATLDASGNGTVSAVVSYGTSTTGVSPALTYDPAQAPVRGPQRVNILNLTGNTSAKASIGSTTATWTDLAASWSPDLASFPNVANPTPANCNVATDCAGFLAGDPSAEPAIGAWSYATTINNTQATGDTRAPLPISFSVTKVAPSVNVTTVSTSPVTGLTISAAATGFSPTDGNPGDDGVYVGIAEAGEFPDTSEFDISAFAAAAWVNGSSIVDGAFTRQLTAPADKLDPSKDYALYTWRAHSHSTTSQNTTTPLTIDFDALEKYDSTTTVTGLAASSAYGTTRTATVTVTGGPVDAPKPTGTVTASIAGDAVASNELDANGVASIELPTLAVGSADIAFAYSGDDAYVSSSDSKQVTVTKASTTTALTGTSGSLVYGQARKANVKVTGPAGTTPSGTVTATTGGTTLGTADVNASGVASITIPANLSVGIRTVTYTYSGDDSFTESSTNGSLTISKSGVRIGDKFTKKPTTKKAGKVAITVKSAIGQLLADGKVKVFFKKSGKSTKATSTKTLKNGKATLTVPKLTKKGTWKVYVTYLGNDKFSSAKLKYVGTVKVTK